MNRFHMLASGQNSVVVDTEVGHLRRLQLGDEQRTIAPLHTAPWVNDDPIDPVSVTAPTEQALSGDFLCAPFCANDVNGGPIHGWTANARWDLVGEEAGVSGAEARFVLSRDVQGAEVTKTLRFNAGQPFLYLEHAFRGGKGDIPIGHHAMIRVTGTAALSFSPKQSYFTPPGPAEGDPARGRSVLRYPSRGTDFSAVPMADGTTADLGTYPLAEKHEDIVSLAEAPGHKLGWTAAVRDEEDDIVLFLRDATALTCTSMWMSNGGRNYAPWSGRHTRVLGLEDTRSYGVGGHRASIGPNPMSDAGIPTAFDLSANPAIRYAIGAIPRPAGWRRVAAVTVAGGIVTLTEQGGAIFTVPFAAGWLD